jgi:3-phosphoshikimate 1-carboxyvinyltransferase
MQVTVYPSVIKGALNAPASKSMTQRAIAAAVLSKGKTVIQRASVCDDALAALRIAEALGATVVRNNTTFTITGNFSAAPGTVLHCNESGLCMRMFAPIAALLSEPVELTGEASLRNRPAHMITEVLTQLGASCTANEGDGALPITIQGPIKGGNITVNGYQTSQLLTGLLMALPLLGEDSEVTAVNLTSKSYVDMTMQLLKQFGVLVRKEREDFYKIRGRQRYVPQTYVVEGDWSGAAFLLVAAALKGDVTIYNLYGNSKQPDSALLKILILVGANIVVNEQDIQVTSIPPALKPFQFDASGCPDLFPPLVALAAYCHGVSVIYGADRLKIKESDRALTLQEEFSKLGVKIDLIDNSLKIHGGLPVQGGVTVSAHNDHRIAMSLAVAALAAENALTIDGAECVNKSYPDFFSDLKALNAGVKTDS